MNTLDFIVVAVVALSGLFAFVRGFVREALSIAAWAGALVVAIYFFTPVEPLVQSIVKSVLAAELIAGIGLFLIAVLLFSILVGIISSRVRSSGLGALDRALGLLFGVVRGVLLVSLGYLVMTHLLKSEDLPPWVVEAHSRPLLAKGAEQLQQMIPHNLPGTLGAAADRLNQVQDTAKAGTDFKNSLDRLNQPPPAKTAVKPASAGNPEANSDTKGLDQLIQAQGTK
ncbi:MAG TPA: CvpA family protein [Aliidongia sp.]|nr:CvpA family protein [Aliidongia sp.]